MSKFIFIEDNTRSMFFLSMNFIWFYFICLMGASPCKVRIIKVRVNTWEGKGFKMVVWWRSCFARYNNPVFLYILFSFVHIWILHDMFSSSINPKNFIYLFLSNVLLGILSSGNFRSISFLNTLWKKMHLAFLIFNDNLLALKHCLIKS